jgi:xanthine dehydrogenase large subunit
LFNQAGALVHVYTDGSVQVNHGGTEMGQGLHTKVAQVVADELGVPLGACWSPPAHRQGAQRQRHRRLQRHRPERQGRPGRGAHVRDNLAAFVAGLDGCGAGAVGFAGGQVFTPAASAPLPRWCNRRTPTASSCGATAFTARPRSTTTSHPHRRPFFYFAYGAACTEVAIDTHTGEYRVLAVDILHDVGRSINPAIDIGQIEGGFVQGMGWLTTEELVWDERGLLATRAPSTYKIPTAADVPAALRRAPVARAQPGRHGLPQQGRGRAALHAGHQRVGSPARGDRRGTRGRWRRSPGARAGGCAADAGARAVGGAGWPGRAGMSLRCFSALAGAHASSAAMNFRVF